MNFFFLDKWFYLSCFALDPMLQLRGRQAILLRVSQNIIFEGHIQWEVLVLCVLSRAVFLSSHFLMNPLESHDSTSLSRRILEFLLWRIKLFSLIWLYSWAAGRLRRRKWRGAIKGDRRDKRKKCRRISGNLRLPDPHILR